MRSHLEIVDLKDQWGISSKAEVQAHHICFLNSIIGYIKIACLGTIARYDFSREMDLPSHVRELWAAPHQDIGSAWVFKH